MRLLFLTSELPYPATSGGAIKTASLLAYLRDRHEVDLLCFRRAVLSGGQARWAAAFGSVATVELNRPRSAANLFRSYIGGIPLSIQRNRSREMADLVSARLSGGRYDAVFVDGWLMAQYLPPWFDRPALLHEHNAEYVMWRRQAEHEANPLRRALVRLEYERVRRYEAAILRRFDAVFAVSEPDRRALIEIGARPERARVLPNLPDPALLEQPALSFAGSEPLVFYFGTLSWQPNVEGVQYLLRDIFPRLRRRLPDVRAVIAGRGAPPAIARLAARTPGVDFVGEIEDADPLYRRARLFVEPTRTGAGTRLKVLNALARGLPVLTTPQGAEGLEVVPGEHLLVASDADSMAEAAARLLTDAALWQTLSDSGRTLVRERYVADVAFRPLDEVLDGARATA